MRAAALAAASAAGWWCLGPLGPWVGLHAAGGLGGLVLWLTATGLLAAALRRWPLPPRWLARGCGLAGLLAGAAAAEAFQTRSLAAGLLAVLAWAGWLAAMATWAAVGQGLRPALPAARGGGLAAATALPAGRRSRAGLLAARWSMWPMMAGLGPMAQWCGAGSRSPAASAVAHLAAMALPGAVLAGLAAWAGRPRGGGLARVLAGPRVRAGLAGTATLAMVASLPVLAWQPGVQGLMLASTCQAVAWGLAVCVQWGVPGAPRACGMAPPTRLAPALALSAAVGLQGLALAEWGPAALRWTHAGLGCLALAGLFRPFRRG